MVPTPSPWIRSIPLAVAFAATAMLAPNAIAGEVKFAAEPLETDDEGKITSDARASATTELRSLPGEEVWPVHLWAKLDKGAPGPLYVEFFGQLPGNGKRYKVAWHHEHGDYEGEPYVSISMELEGNVGFNKGKTYTVELNQLNDKGKNIKLASSKLTLTYTEAEPDDDGEGDGDDGDELSEQDVLDSFAGGDEEPGDVGPPPVTPPATKKGCHVEPGTGAAPGVLVLLMLGAGLAIRRRD